MKTTLTVSVVANVLLLGGAVFLWRHPRVVTISSAVTPATVAEVEPQIAHAPVVQTVTAPARWSDLLSTNGYRAFVANLRAAGCPEATVEDIVRGDTGRAYAAMRQRYGLSATASGRWSEEAQAQMAAYFLGRAPAVEAGEAQPAIAVAGQNGLAPVDPQTASAALAAFLQNTDFTTPDMPAEQQEEIAGLRQGLLAQLGSASQAPNSDASKPSLTTANNTASPQAIPDNAPSPDISADNPQSSQDGNGNGQPQHPHGSQALFQAANQQSILAGLFGMGAAVQYNQSQMAQGQGRGQQ